MGSKHQRILRRPRMVIVATGVAFLIALGLLIHLAMPACPASAPGRWQPAHRPGQGALAPAPALWRGSTHLVLVAGHAVFTGASRSASSIQSEASWYLEPFQRGQLVTMLQHIQRGVAIAASDNASLLVFSGGETRAAAGPRSEASSYWEAADALGWYGRPAVRMRSLLESHARDSFENLLFALCRFREASGRYPTRVTVVSFGFKRRRFTEVRHRAVVVRVSLCFTCGARSAASCHSGRPRLLSRCVPHLFMRSRVPSLSAAAPLRAALSALTLLVRWHRPAWPWARSPAWRARTQLEAV